MNLFRYLFSSFIALMLTFVSVADTLDKQMANSAPIAQSTAVTSQNVTEMADIMRSNGKIYVVVAVLATIFVGIIGYLIYIDKKLSKLEKNQL